MELLGEVMEAYAATNDKLPCLGYALDAGSSNYLARKLSLGLESLDKFEHMAFWKDCIHKPVGLGVYFPFAVLHHKPSSEIILASLDNLHLMKRLGAHHCSGTRCVQYGNSSCHLTPGLPPKAYTMDDAMSDRQEAERTNPALMKNSWISFGHHAYALVSSLVAQCGEAGEMLSSTERLMSAATCYFFLLMNDMLTKQQHGEHVEKYRLPTTTLRNTLHGLYLSMLCNLFPGKVGRDSTSVRSFQEKCLRAPLFSSKGPVQRNPQLRSRRVGRAQGPPATGACQVEGERARVRPRPALGSQDNHRGKHARRSLDTSLHIRRADSQGDPRRLPGMVAQRWPRLGHTGSGTGCG